MEAKGHLVGGEVTEVGWTETQGTRRPGVTRGKDGHENQGGLGGLRGREAVMEAKGTETRRGDTQNQGGCAWEGGASTEARGNTEESTEAGVGGHRDGLGDRAAQP
jgi:hypothetical protein